MDSLIVGPFLRRQKDIVNKIRRKNYARAHKE